ncbi:hypothetical protein EJ08DRAFT_653378 [Tothia fuscella]|uniref:F-box domain-containing protein n=1 Tax=Tothia fuscella TaxID=1048955 RepID=A0A9P4NHG2_9PEZI|nr:hypothetical protein EJ08DRAFT_653378 [Tothia fuscella]
MATCSFTDLPIDILLLIFPYLDAKSFLSLTSTCKALYQGGIRNDASYWSHATRAKFRIRNRPAVQSDGLHWQRLYKRLLAQTKVYTWGQNTNDCLGRKRVDGNFPGGPNGGRLRFLPQGRLNADKADWPEQIKMPEPNIIGVVADLQCGGWSTSILNEKGVLRVIGTLNGMSQYNAQGVHPVPMIYPAGFPKPEERYNPAVALSEFSSGRSHILGLSDSGIIWSWYDKSARGVQVQFLNIKSSQESSKSKEPQEMLDGSVRTVVAGWDKSSAYIRGTGIVVWIPLIAPHDETIDTMEVSDWAFVPKTDYRRPRGNAREPDESTRLLGQEVGEVTNYIVLEHYIVFITDIKKVFAASFTMNERAGVIDDTFELVDLQAASETDNTPSATDVQGSFCSFAIFKGKGTVVTTNQDYLDACLKRARGESTDELPAVNKIPALQNTGVTSVAFGDYHYHALHSDGSISSYGVEPGACGALGLGGGMGVPIPIGTIRGIKYNPWNSDGTLLPHAYFRGRKIWFHREQEEWLRMLARGGKDPEEAKERVTMCSSVPPVQGEVSEWIEQMGGEWDKRPEVAQQDEDGLGAYFALSVAAAGWHSGALVLVNEKLVKAVEDSCFIELPPTQAFKNMASAGEGSSSGHWQYERPVAVDDQSVLTRTLTSLREGFFSLFGIAEDVPEEEEGPPRQPQRQKQRQAIDFPRLKLDDGLEMEGQIPFSGWKTPKPDWKLEWRSGALSKVFGVEGWEIRV